MRNQLYFYSMSSKWTRTCACWQTSVVRELANTVELILQRWTFAEECMAAGWAHTTPLYIQPHCVGQALEVARTNRIGAWGLQTDERPFQGK